MDEPWALDYVTHQGQHERYFMEPGDIALYEGASVMHGRADPLKARGARGSARAVLVVCQGSARERGGVGDAWSKVRGASGDEFTNVVSRSRVVLEQSTLVLP